MLITRPNNNASRWRHSQHARPRPQHQEEAPFSGRQEELWQAHMHSDMRAKQPLHSRTDPATAYRLFGVTFVSNFRTTDHGPRRV